VASRASGALAVAVLWIGIGVAIARTNFRVSGDLPLSRLAAANEAGSTFGPSLVLAALLFIVFSFDLTRRYPTSRAFAPLMVTAMAGQIVAGVVPIGDGDESAPVHVIAGLVLGGLIPVFLCVFALSQRPRSWRQTAFGLFVAQATGTMTGVVLSRMGVAALAEIIPALAFHAWVIVVTVHDPADTEEDLAAARR
jgi:hypothetical membrane protein